MPVMPGRQMPPIVAGVTVHWGGVAEVERQSIICPRHRAIDAGLSLPAASGCRQNSGLIKTCDPHFSKAAPGSGGGQDRRRPREKITGQTKNPAARPGFFGF
jgi:hypothetical protein